MVVVDDVGDDPWPRWDGDWKDSNDSRDGDFHGGHDRYDANSYC